ncbi:MAG: polysaccharide deacetylase family protein, partial [Solirubrobacteraceae bacterium]
GDPAIQSEIARLKALRPDLIERYVLEQFGPGALIPREDLDRPLTPRELQRLAAERQIGLGNHTMDHVILTTVGRAEVESQLAGACRYLEDATGAPVRTVAYPNGDYDQQIVDVARGLGHTVGVTTLRRKELVAQMHQHRYELGRFQFERQTDLMAQMRAIRSGFHLADALRRVKGRSG